MKEFIEKLICRLEEEQEYQYKKSDEADEFEEIGVKTARNRMGDCYYHAIEIVNQLAEEYNNGWIPCSERLPDEFGFYLVSRKDCIISDIALYNPKFKQWDSDDIIAWQPRPEPYQPKGE